MTFRVMTNILYKGIINDGIETCMLNVDGNMDDVKDYVGTRVIIES